MDHSDLFKKFGLNPPEPFSTELSIHVGESHNEIRLIIKHHLNKLGFNNVRADRDGHASLAELKVKPAHIALEGDDLDVVTGYDMLKELMEDPNVSRPPFILMSKPLNKAELMFALEMGMDDILVRPISQGDLLPKIRNAYNVFNNPKNPERVYELAKAKLRAEDYPQAFQIYSELTKVSEKAARPYIGMARVQIKQNSLEEALGYVNKGIEKNENYIHAYVVRADIYTAMKQDEKALEDLKKALELSPMNIIRYEGCTESLLKQNKIDECLSILNIGASAGLKHPYIIERLGYCYFLKKDYVNALKLLKEAVRIDPENVSYANSLAICYRDSKDFEKAVLTYNQILKKQPDNHLVLFNKAVTLIFWDKKDEAIKILRRILKIDPNYNKAKEKLSELGASIEG
ncbi:tetratricopeptide repeat protein [Pigmentibacter ruber]|uniref:tetratricopeptide repeat protein n=1 Tax=Pigmentibacter ruber TaxID=2683196 RepID=UPI00131DFB38|nr:tetratricopeptide repeat protein [Pigmentibacter ruber]